MELASWGTWRYPEAVATQTGTGWVILLEGSAIRSLPKGVIYDDDFGGPVERLSSTTAGALDDLRDALTNPCDAESARLVARHVGEHFAPEICGRHGLPYWHLAKGQCPPGGIEGESAVALPLGQLRALLVFLDAVNDAVEQVHGKRAPLTARQALDLLSYLRLPAVDGIVKGEVAGSGRLEIPRSKQLVRMALDESVRASGLQLSARWPDRRAPQMALVARSSTALYVADLLLLLGRADGAICCTACGNHFTPRRAARSGETLYCQRPECQRQRLAANQARYRERKSRG